MEKPVLLLSPTHSLPPSTDINIRFPNGEILIQLKLIFWTVCILDTVDTWYVYVKMSWMSCHKESQIVRLTQLMKVAWGHHQVWPYRADLVNNKSHHGSPLPAVRRGGWPAVPVSPSCRPGGETPTELLLCQTCVSSARLETDRSVRWGQQDFTGLASSHYCGAGDGRSLFSLEGRQWRHSVKWSLPGKSEPGSRPKLALSKVGAQETLLFKVWQTGNDRNGHGLVDSHCVSPFIFDRQIYSYICIKKNNFDHFNQQRPIGHKYSI